MKLNVILGKQAEISRSILLIGLLGFIAAILLPSAPGLSRAGQNTWGIFILSASLWVTSYIPLSITGLLAIVLLPLLNVMPSQEAFSLFGNPVVFFIIGALILAAGLMRSGLSRRLALIFLKRFDRSPKMLLAGVLLISAFLSFWMPEHAVAAMMFPLVMEIAAGLKLSPLKSQYGKALFISMAWGAVIGGVATLLGGARNPLAIGMLRENYDLEISFLGWTIAVLPLVIALMGAALLIILKSFHIDIDDVSLAKDVVQEKIEAIGPMSLQEKKILALTIGTILFWIFLGHRLGLAVIAILAVVFMFLFRMVTWRDVENYVNWGVILMYGGAIALGSALARTGAAYWLVRGFGEGFLTNPLLLIIIISGLSIILTEGMSNVATVAVVLPICFGLFNTANLDPRMAVFVVALPAGLAFCLPVGTPANAIAISSGYFRVSDMVSRGVFLAFLAWILFILMVIFYWPIIGLAY